MTAFDSTKHCRWELIDSLIDQHGRWRIIQNFQLIPLSRNWNNRNLDGFLQTWPLWYFSSQLKHSPTSCCVFSSSSVNCLTPNGIFLSLALSGFSSRDFVYELNEDFHWSLIFVSWISANFLAADTILGSNGITSFLISKWRASIKVSIRNWRLKPWT